MKKAFTLLFVFCSIHVTAQTLDSLPKEYKNHIFLGQEKNLKRNFHIGMEMAELIQHKFDNYGPANFTIIGGMRFRKGIMRLFGLSYLFVNADLGKDHLMNPNEVCCIEGDRSYLSGNIMYQRIYFDTYPITFKLGAIRKWKRHVLTIKPIVGAGFGYSNWVFKNSDPALLPDVNNEYDLKAFSFNIGIKIRSELFNILFVDIPFYDLGILIAKNRSAQGDIGGVQLSRPEFFTLTSLWNAGIQVDF